MSPLSQIAGAAYGTHVADQIALVAVPLVAALAFGASPALIGVLVACQSSAHLLGSIPFGLLIDHGRLRRLAITSTIVLLAGFASASVSVWLGAIFWFGASITVAGFGTVLFSLTALSILPKVAGARSLASANAAIEIPRALSSFAIPLAVGLFIADVPPWAVFAVGGLGAVMALICAASLPSFEEVPKLAEPVLPRIAAGGRYVIGHHLLLPISICAIFWNLAFAALLVVVVPAIRDAWSFDPGAFGIALSAFGLGAFVGTSLARRVADSIQPWIVLLFGPGISAVAAAGLVLIGPGSATAALYTSFLLLGFGPSMWLIAQNSVRQLVSPPAMLGRVNAVIQTAIYGVRPVGALIGGVVAGRAGPEAGLALVAVAFAISFAVPVLSDLRRIRSYESLKACHRVADV